METDNTGTVQAIYTYGKGLISMNRADANSYYHYDGLGSTRQLTNSSGAVTVSYMYDSFGNLVASSGSITNAYGYTGQQQFGEADNLVFLRARYYDPRVGRFISRDPLLSIEYHAVRGIDLNKSKAWSKVKPGWLNPYIYCLNNPVNLIDPTGGCAKSGPEHAIDIAEIIRDAEDLADCTYRCAQKFVGDEACGPHQGPGNYAAEGICVDACWAAYDAGRWDD